MTPPVYTACSIKRARRTKFEMETLREAIYGIPQSNNPATVRECYYALIVRGMIEKTEQEYNGTIVRLLTQTRRDRVIPYSWISNNTRWIRKPDSYRGIAHFMRQTARLYRRDLWVDADVSLEVWCEKDALAGVIIEESDPYDVPLMVSRGFSSDTYLHAAAATIEDKGSERKLITGLVAMILAGGAL